MDRKCWVLLAVWIVVGGALLAQGGVILSHLWPVVGWTQIAYLFLAFGVGRLKGRKLLTKTAQKILTKEWNLNFGIRCSLLIFSMIFMSRLVGAYSSLARGLLLVAVGTALWEGAWMTLLQQSKPKDVELK